MRKNLLHFFFNSEYVFAALLALLFVRILYLISDNLPDTDNTSFLDPIFGRIDFLNIKDVSLDAIFAMKDMHFADPRILVVNVGETAPTPDGKIALLLRRLHAWKARAIGIDVIFDDLHFERFPPERRFEIDALREALRAVPRVTLVDGYDENLLRPSLHIDSAVAAAVGSFGYANLSPDDDGVIRRFYPWRSIAGVRRLAFPIALLTQYDSTLVAGMLSMPEEEQIIYYAGTTAQFSVVPIDDLLTDDRYADRCGGAIVLIGLTTERGLSYLGDMHRTPMGKKTVVYRPDGTSTTGVEGADMPGLLIHANVVNMLLKREFIFPVPAWMDWVLAFLLNYISIALYRVLRSKPQTRLGVGLLIGGFIIVETIVVFFIPIIAFFYFSTKISYHLMATSVLMFIPAFAWVTKIRYALLHRRTRRLLRRLPRPLTDPLLHAFEDDQPYPSYVGSLHAAEVFLHFAYAVELARRGRERISPEMFLFPELPQWREAIRAVEALWSSSRRGDAWQRYYYAFLAGKKAQYLRDSEVKRQFLSTQYDEFNEHVYFDEWDLFIPHVLRMIHSDLRAYHDLLLFDVAWNNGAGPRVQSIGFDVDTPLLTLGRVTLREDGLYAAPAADPEALAPLGPFCILAECKLHRETELFVFAGLLRKQMLGGMIPAYYGRTICCEAVVPDESLAWFHQHSIHHGGAAA